MALKITRTRKNSFQENKVVRVQVSRGRNLSKQKKRNSKKIMIEIRKFNLKTGTLNHRKPMKSLACISIQMSELWTLIIIVLIIMPTKIPAKKRRQTPKSIEVARVIYSKTHRPIQNKFQMMYQ